MNPSKSLKPLMGLMAGLFFLLMAGTPLSAEEDEVSTLRRRVAELEKKIEQMERLLNEKQDPSKNWSVHDYGWQNKKNWRLLRVGMKEDQVKELLGDPVKLIAGVRTLWYYPNIYCGYVSFDEEGHLIGWNEP